MLRSTLKWKIAAFSISFGLASLLLVRAYTLAAVSSRSFGFLSFILVGISSVAVFYIFWSENRQTGRSVDRGNRKRLEKGIRSCYGLICFIALGTASAIMEFNRNELLASSVPIVMGLFFIGALLVTSFSFKKSLNRLESEAGDDPSAARADQH